MEKISLYIHIPFCKQKCMYCDFPSYANKEGLMEEYVGCLTKEIRYKCKDYKIETIFIGGGTPSHLPINLMEKILKEIQKLHLCNDIEFTVECNPGSLTAEKLRVMKSLGVNRISMGLQAVQSSILKGIGRIHNFEEFKDNFMIAREVGFSNINVDIMFGLPNQSVEQWRETLEVVTDLKPEHISAYSLIVEEGTLFYTMNEKGKLLIPTEDDEREMYNLILEVLSKKGYHKYEISNYAKENKECKHNLVYWDTKQWIGVGSAAASFIHGKRLKNFTFIEDYIEAIKSTKSTYEEIIENTKNDNMEEFMFMGLRKVKGIEVDDFEKRFNTSLDEIYGAVINKYIVSGLLIREGGKIYLSKEGIEVSNIVMSDFLLT